MDGVTAAHTERLKALIAKYREASRSLRQRAEQGGTVGLLLIDQADRLDACAADIAALLTEAEVRTEGARVVEHDVKPSMSAIDVLTNPPKFPELKRTEGAGAAKEIGRALNLMTIRKWVDEGFGIQKRLGYLKATLASTIAAQIWLHVREVLDGEQPSPCHCGCSRAAHTYYESGGIFTACQVCACEAYAPSEAAGAPAQEKECD